jgi:hypothetical protein
MHRNGAAVHRGLAEVRAALALNGSRSALSLCIVQIFLALCLRGNFDAGQMAVPDCRPPESFADGTGQRERKSAMNAQSPIGFSYDPYARDVLDNPLPYYRELLENHPGYYVDKYDMFVFTRFQDIIEVASVTDDNTFVGSESTLPMPAAITHKNDGPPSFVSTKPMSPGIMLPSPEYEEMRLAHIKPLRP